MSAGRVYERLVTSVDGLVKRDEPLAKHTTYRIGGPAALFIECDSVTDLERTIETCAEESLEWTILGKGSNILASDDGYGGAVLVLGKGFKRHHCDGDSVTSGAAVILAALVQQAFKQGQTGLEFAVGIPGTLGGALAMNAGTRDDWIGSIVESVTVYVPGSGLTNVRGPEIDWGYRRSGLTRRGVIVESTLALKQGDASHIRQVMEASLRRRKRNQPLGTPNAGSVFVNPPGDSAGRIIESLGLKGASVGGAQISDVHANFIVNTGNATASDVIALIARVRDAAREAHGIELTPEIRFLGSFESA